MTALTRFIALALTFSLAPAVLRAQNAEDDYKPKGRAERKALKLIEGSNKGPDVKVVDGVAVKNNKAKFIEFDDLDAKDQMFIIRKVADAMEEAKAKNRAARKRGSKVRTWVKDVDLKVFIDDTDLKRLEEKYDAQIGDGVVVSNSETATPVDPITKRIPAPFVPLEYHPNPAFMNLFANNSWEIKDDPATDVKPDATDDDKEKISDAQALRNQIDAFLAELGPDGWIYSVKIAASCSTPANSVKSLRDPSVMMPHLELAEYRALAASKFVLSYLQSKGVKLDRALIPPPDFKGDNEDGTSGPAPHSGLPGAKGDGTPILKPFEYAQFRKVDIQIEGMKLADGGEPTFEKIAQDPLWMAEETVLDINFGSKKKWKWKITVGHKHPKKQGKGWGYVKYGCPGERTLLWKMVHPWKMFKFKKKTNKYKHF